MAWTSVNNCLQRYASEVEAILKRQCNVDTGSLRDSIVVRAEVDGSNYSLTIDLAYYYKYIRRNIPPVTPEAVPAQQVIDISDKNIPARYVDLPQRIRQMYTQLQQAFVDDILEGAIM